MGAPAATKTSKKVSAPKSSLSHPPYIQMITEAIVSLKERTGSSHYAIAKHIEEEQKIKELPANFKKQLSVQLKKFVASGKLVAVKKSFKLPTMTPAKAKSTATDTAVEKKARKPATTAAAKPKAAVKKAAAKGGKTKSLKVVKSPMKKKAAPAVAKAKKPKSIKSPVKKVVKKAAAAPKKAAAPVAKKANK